MIFDTYMVNWGSCEISIKKTSKWVISQVPETYCIFEDDFCIDKLILPVHVGELVK